MSRIRHLVRLVIISAILFSGFPHVKADVQLAGVFTDHMVLQRQAKVSVWGTAIDGEKITVTIGGQTHTTAASKGTWRIQLDPLAAGGPHTLTVAGANKLTVQDILVGEVWLCSGQSNMAMTVNRAKDFESEAKSANHPQIRMYTVTKNATPELQTDCQGTWQLCQPDSVGTFSATAYFFGRKLQQELKVPVGLINSSWGGTDVAAWTSLPAQQAVAGIVPKIEAYNKTIASYDASASAARNEKALARWKEAAARARAAGEKIPRRPRPQVDPAVNQNRPANLYNGMIHPLVGYGIRGAIWYQGERNARTISDGLLYGTQLKTMITDWRKRWGIGDFQFITVQLPNFKAKQEEPVQNTGWVAVRESELKTLRLPNTGIAITTDVGEANDIHPKNKQTVGHRLALWALGTTYRQEILHSGPL
ncbi:MAG: sialate O-acetylesterase, partial [Pirellulaceae bacterium]